MIITYIGFGTVAYTVWTHFKDTHQQLIFVNSEKQHIFLKKVGIIHEFYHDIESVTIPRGVIIYTNGVKNHGQAQKLGLEGSIKKNTNEVVQLLKRKNHLILCFSSCALYEGFGEREGEEGSGLYTEYFNNYTAAHYELERICRSDASNQIMVLRLGSLITQKFHGAGSSESLCKMIEDASFGLDVSIKNGHLHRGLLWKDDLLLILNNIISSGLETYPRIYNVSSYNKTVEQFGLDLCRTFNVNATFSRDDKNQKGWSVNTSKKEYELGAPRNILRYKQFLEMLLKNGKKLCSSYKENKIPERQIFCKICSQETCSSILDIGETVLANSYLKIPIDQEKYPLNLVHCLNCHHNQLMYNVDPKLMFENYLHSSGSVETSKQHFSEFFEMNSGGKEGVVFEIACNDGSQLDVFSSNGWKTYGVDPAENLTPNCDPKHKILSSFWGLNEDSHNFIQNNEDLRNKNVDIIIAQNILAYVPYPAEILLITHKIMNENTKLYIQTSQSEMFQNGEFDTIYHEHFSYFNVFSMKKLAERCDFYIEKVEKVSIHGKSYLFCLRKNSCGKRHGDSVEIFEKEEFMLKDPLFYKEYKVNVNKRIGILRKITDQFDGKISYYTVPAKGMTLVHSLGKNNVKYAIDNSALKQNLFTPDGKTMILSPQDYILQASKDKKLDNILLLLAWNHLDEAFKNIRLLLQQINGLDENIREIKVIVPFPDVKIVSVGLEHPEELPVLYEGPSRQILPEKRRKTVLITHMRNEHDMLPFFIRQHASNFDKAVFFDYGSQNDFKVMFDQLAPSTWKWTRSRNNNLNAALVDEEIRDYVSEHHKHDFVLILTMTEFLVHPDLRADVAFAPDDYLRRFLCMVSSPEFLGPLVNRFDYLPTQLNKHDNVEVINEVYTRVGNIGPIDFVPGRHALVNFDKNEIPVNESGYLIKMKFSYYPESILRRCQLTGLIPTMDFPNRMEQIYEVDEIKKVTELCKRDKKCFKSSLSQVCPGTSIIPGRIFCEFYDQMIEF